MIIAELSANHGKSFEKAKELIEVAAHLCNADAIKLQTYRADDITIDCDLPDFVCQTEPWKGRRLHDLYREAATPFSWHAELFRYAHGLGLECFSSPFSIQAVNFLEDTINPLYYKVASFEITDLALIQRIGETRKKVFMSLGCADDADVTRAISAVGNHSPIVLMHCVSAYPTRPEMANLARIPMLKGRWAEYGIEIGLSDHSMSVHVPVAATALGATSIEKHLILDRREGGPDAAFSLEPMEFRDMANAVLETREAIKYRDKIPNRDLVRSLYVCENISEGEVFTHKNVRSIRPGHGCAPRHLPAIIGRSAKHAIKRGTPMSMEFVR